MIKITAVSYNHQASFAPLSAVFGSPGATLGRGSDNHFVLPDPKNMISRTQARISSESGRHNIVNLSRASPILLNGNDIGYNLEFPIQPGDELLIGLYLLQVEAVGGEEDDKPINGQAQAHTTDGVFDPPTMGQGWSPEEASAVAARRSANLESNASGTLVSDAESGQLMQAFLRGANLADAGIGSRLTPEFMEMLGKLVASSVRGTFDLLAARAAVKREVKADVTMVVLRNNNPLKFLPDSQTVLIQMLRKKMPGFMAPGEAVDDAFNDLHAHQSGLAAGMHGAIQELLKYLSPGTLNQQVTSSSFLDSAVPGRRKAQLWDAYQAAHADLAMQVTQDFQSLLGKAFLAAYEDEIERQLRLHNDD